MLGTSEAIKALIPAGATIAGAVLAILGGFFQSWLVRKKEKQEKLLSKREGFYLRLIDLSLNFEDDIDKYSKTGKRPEGKSLDDLTEFLRRYQSRIILYATLTPISDYQSLWHRYVACMKNEKPPAAEQIKDFKSAIIKMAKDMREDLGIKRS